MNYLTYIAILSILLPLSSCKSVTSQSKSSTILDVSQEDKLGGTGTSSTDIRSMAERMARDISGIDWQSDIGFIYINIRSVDNQSRFFINPNLLKDRLLTDLMEFSQNPKIRFTNNDSMANHHLLVRITALSKGTRAGVSDYMLYSFQLIDNNGTILWMKSYETKKQGNTGIMYR